MDIAAVSIGINQSSLSEQVGIALCKKTIDLAKENSQNLIKTMELSANPNLGSILDSKA